MSYIAKVYLNKMFPKRGEDAIRVEGDYLIIPFISAMNPITADNPPEKIEESFDILGDDTPIVGKQAQENVSKVVMIWDGKEYTAENYMELKDKVLPQFGKVIFKIPNVLGWKSGEKHKITVKIYQDRPISFTIQRTIA